MEVSPAEMSVACEAQIKPSFVRRNWRRAKFVASGPAANVGFHEISEGRRLIGGLWGQLRYGVQRDSRLRTSDDDRIDLPATAFSYGVRLETLMDRLRSRQRQTARTAYGTFGLGCFSLVLWVYGVLHLEMSAARLVSALEFLPFCALLFLLSFKCAWMNWQLRTRRLGSAAVYLTTTEPFLPR
jgi:hypothetical protein